MNKFGEAKYSNEKEKYRFAAWDYLHPDFNLCPDFSRQRYLETEG
jgi:hypothetical protein